jgi:hypothetical protein
LGSRISASSAEAGIQACFFIPRTAGTHLDPMTAEEGLDPGLRRDDGTKTKKARQSAGLLLN